MKNLTTIANLSFLLFALSANTPSFSQETSDPFLPVAVIHWNATIKNNDVELTWTTTISDNTNNFVIERSITGVHYKEIASLSTAGNNDVTHKYNYADKLSSGSKGTIYYRLKGTDVNGRIMRSDIRMVRVENITNEKLISGFPNPTVNQLQVTTPMDWQNQKVTYAIYDANGLPVKQIVRAQASKTEAIAMSELGKGMYIIKASSGSESATFTMIKL